LRLRHLASERELWTRVAIEARCRTSPRISRDDTDAAEMDEAHAAALQALIEHEASSCVVLDLREVTLVDRNAVRYLAQAAAGGATLVNCPEYVRSLMEAERGSRRCSARPKKRRHAAPCMPRELCGVERDPMATITIKDGTEIVPPSRAGTTLGRDRGRRARVVICKTARICRTLIYSFQSSCDRSQFRSGTACR
jgi:hypothetical protein